MKRRFCLLVMIVLVLQVFIPFNGNFESAGALSYAEGTDEGAGKSADKSTDMYLQSGDRYYVVKDDLSSFKQCSQAIYLQHQPPELPPVEGIDAFKIPYEQKDRDIYARGVKVFTLEKDPADNEFVHNNVSELYEIKTKDQRLFYYIVHGDGIAHPNSYGDTYTLVEVKDGKVIHQMKVYDGLEYITSDLWRSTASFSGAGIYLLTQHSISGKFKDNNLNDLVINYALKQGHTFKSEMGDIEYIGKMDDSVFFGLKCRDRKGAQLPRIEIYEVTVDGTVRELREVSKSLTNNLFIHNYCIYSLDQDGQVLRRLSDLRSIYFEGSSARLGTFDLTKKTALKAKLPVYSYRGQEFICLEDLTLMGYHMKWDAKAKVGHWTYTGKKVGKPHVFKKKVIYDNDVFATVKGRYAHIYNAEGYSLISLGDVEYALAN